MTATSTGTMNGVFTAPRRALRLDLVLQRPLLLGYGVLTVIVLALSLTDVARFGGVLLLLAVAAPAGAGPRDPDREAMWRASLGVSRAAHVRARTRVLLALQSALLLIAALVLFLGPHGADEAAVRDWARPGGVVDVPVPTTAFWLDVLRWAPAVLFSHVSCGRQALQRSGTAVWISGLGTYLGTYLIMTFLFGLVVPALRLPPVQELAGLPTEQLTPWVLAAIGVFGTVLAVVVLRRRARVWARSA